MPKSYEPDKETAIQFQKQPSSHLCLVLSDCVIYHLIHAKTTSNNVKEKLKKNVNPFTLFKITTTLRTFECNSDETKAILLM